MSTFDLKEFKSKRCEKNRTQLEWAAICLDPDDPALLQCVATCNEACIR